MPRLSEIGNRIYFSIMKDIRKPNELDEITLEGLLQSMQDSAIRTETIRFRSFVSALDLANENDKKLYSKEKAERFSAITPAGVFSNERKNENLIFYSDIVHMDFDKITDEQKESILTYLKRKDDALSRSVIFAFTSPSNSGLKVFHAVKKNAKEPSVESIQLLHKAMFQQIANEYIKKGLFEEEKLDAQIHDISRSCYICYDENMLINQEFEAFDFGDLEKRIDSASAQAALSEELYVNWTKNCRSLNVSIEDKVSQLDQLIKWLEKKKLSITSEYQNWYRVIFALKKELPEALAYKYARLFSALDKSFSQKEFDKKFKQANFNVGKAPSFRSIMYFASELGYVCKKTEFNKAYFRAIELEDFFKKMADNKFVTRYNTMYCTLEVHDFATGSWERMSDDKHLIPLTVDMLGFAERDKKEVYAKLITYSEKFDPVEQFKNSLPEWDKTDRLCLVVNALNLDNIEDKGWATLFFRLWMVGFWAGLLTDSYNENMIILQGLGGLGKTRFIKRLFTVFKECGMNMNDYFTVKNIDAGNKDHLLEMTSKFVILNDELETLTNKKDNLDALKAMMSADNFSLRQIYKINNTSFKRYANMIGTINNHSFLKDPTGNRRFWVLPIANKIDQNFEIDLKQLFAQTLFMFENGERYYLSDVEKNELDKYQVRFETPTMEEELLLNHVERDPNNEMSTTDILIEVSRMEGVWAGKSVQQFGKLLHKHFSDVFFTKSPGQLPRKGYRVKVVYKVQELLNGAKVMNEAQLMEANLAKKPLPNDKNSLQLFNSSRDDVTCNVLPMNM